jgi:hypothetical protein
VGSHQGSCAERAQNPALFHSAILLTLLRIRNQEAKEGGEFKASLGYVVRPCLKTKR